MVTNLTKTPARRARAIPSTARRSTARLHRHPAHRRLLDLTGFELYAVLSYRLAVTVLVVFAVLHVGGH